MLTAHAILPFSGKVLQVFANLCRATLSRANLAGANLYGVNLMHPDDGT